MKILRKSLSRFVLILLILLFSVRIAPGQNYWVVITNKTDHYIHVIINNQSFLYIAPEDYIRANFPIRELQVKVFYAPGQAVTGKVERELYAPGESGGSCERNVFCNTVPLANVTWQVTVADIQGGEN